MTAAAAAFDPYDWDGHFVGDMDRETANVLLDGAPEGSFFVRNSSTIDGYVLCVREEKRNSHYLITKQRKGDNPDKIQFEIGEQIFPDMGNLLEFYKWHILETSTLLYPLQRELEVVVARYEFHGERSQDLSFKKGARLSVLRKEGAWWYAKDSEGNLGEIPANRVEKMGDNERASTATAKNDTATQNGTASSPRPSVTANTNPDHKPDIAHNNRRSNVQQRSLPAWARVKTERVPNAYDKNALRLRVGDLIKVLEMDLSGTWTGELNGKSGTFPMTFIEWIDSASPNETDQSKS